MARQIGFRRDVVGDDRQLCYLDHHDRHGWHSRDGPARLWRGLPATLTELVVEMKEWFVQTSADSDAPDESTIRKRIGPIWYQLSAPVPA
ncbi:hypothetical protein FQV27_16710 [Paracoccus aurantiacus]|uniref:Uncharacterized protein n=1 Tax=Paracoccus aurantiacus TaxID=2599412 RepID=A0A5C6RWE0_9RHOB|nr:hypothetical protein FQV27_16710 [Paracoccus aurantiacus]